MAKWSATDPEVREQARIWSLTPDMVATAWNWSAAATQTVSRNEVRRVVSDAYYDARNNQQTMEQAADNAADAVMALIEEKA